MPEGPSVLAVGLHHVLPQGQEGLRLSPPLIGGQLSPVTEQAPRSSPMRQEGVTDKLERRGVEAEGWFTDHLLGSTGVAKTENFLKEPPFQWPSRISNVHPFHWLDTEPWLWADNDNQAKQVQLVVRPTHQHSTILAERGSLGLLLVLIVIQGVTGRTAY